MNPNLRKMAATMMGCGASRVRIRQSKEAEEALTRDDVRNLIASGIITKMQKKGTSRAYAKVRAAQKKRGRRSGEGSRKGSAGARSPEKPAWIRAVRAQRQLLKELRGQGTLKKEAYRNVYRRVKGGTFRSKSRLMAYLEEQELLTSRKK